MLLRLPKLFFSHAQMIVEYFHDYDKHKIICIWNNRIDGLSKRSILNLYNTVIPVPVKDIPEIDFTANETQNPNGSFLCLFFGAMRYNILLLQFSFTCETGYVRSPSDGLLVMITNLSPGQTEVRFHAENLYEIFLSSGNTCNEGQLLCNCLCTWWANESWTGLEL